MAEIESAPAGEVIGPQLVRYAYGDAGKEAVHWPLYHLSSCIKEVSLMRLKGSSTFKSVGILINGSLHQRRTEWKELNKAICTTHQVTSTQTSILRNT